MSVPAFAQRLRDEYATLQAQLPPDIVQPELRRSALERLATLGLPGLRDDDWRYANLRPLQSATLAPANDAAPGRLPLPLPALLPGALRLVFVDGRLQAALSGDAGDFPGFTVLDRARDPASRGDEERFALLNDVFAVDAAQFAVRGEASLDLLFVSSGDGPATYPRVQLKLEAGAGLTLVERHVGGGADALVASSVDLHLGRDARLKHTRLQDLSPDALYLDTLNARVDAGATYELVQLQLGGGAVRSTLGVDLAGRGARVQLAAASLADGSRTLDTALRLRHLAPDTVSLQELRAIAADRSRIAFQSSVVMTREAPGADSRQSLKGLVGGDTAEINLRPQLEIDIDSVRASHGATTGALDEATLFYLLSRGLDRETARLLLEWAFIEAVMTHITVPALRREAEERAVARLGNRAAAELLQ
jgi:Fe-S cluster assembly protein SufD